MKISNKEVKLLHKRITEYLSYNRSNDALLSVIDIIESINFEGKVFYCTLLESRIGWILKKNLEDLPLMINELDGYRAVIVQWRLEIGK